MTNLRDYLAAHAPDAPDWYKTTRLEYPKFMIQEPKHPEHFSTEEIKSLYFGWIHDPCWDLDEPELRQIVEQWERFWSQRSAYNEQRSLALITHKHTSWRYYYADQMIAERRKNMPRPVWLTPVFALLFMLFLSICYLVTSYLENSNAIL